MLESGPSTFALSGVLAPDPGPGGLASALTYDLLADNLVAGDVLLIDLAGLSDIIRFNAANPCTGYPASAVFYSSPGGGDLADTGFPLGLYANIVVLMENEAGATVYTPSSGQPGFGPGTFSTTYRFFSGSARRVPEGGKGALFLGFSFVALASYGGKARLARVLSWKKRDPSRLPAVR